MQIIYHSEITPDSLEVVSQPRITPDGKAQAASKAQLQDSM